MEDDIRFSEEDYASIEACRIASQALYAKGDHEGGRLASAQGGRIINRSSLQKLESCNFENNEQLVFLEIPDQATTVKGVRINLHLLSDSDLYRDILEVLQKHHQKG